jgi:SET family sugar efflux transporter-like MFS transporter
MAAEVGQRSRRGSAALLPLGLVFLAVGISIAVALPFLSLFLSSAVHAGPVQVTAFLIAMPLSGVLVSTRIGRLSDQRPIRRGLLIAGSAAGFISSGLTVFVRDYRVLFALTVTATALAGTLIPQLFAYAREVLARDGANAAMGISALRTVFSLAWVAGPPLATLLLEVGGFAAVYGAAAAMYAVAAWVAIFWLEPVDARRSPTAARGDGPTPGVPDARAASRHTLLLTAAGFTLLQTPLTLGVQALPLFISSDLGGHLSDAGLILGLCAALEIPLMLAMGALTTRIPLRALVLGGCGCGVVYYAVAAATTGVPLLAAVQLVNAVYIAAVSGLGISYMQELLPSYPGRATTLFTNSFPAGAMLAGPLFGLAQHFGFRLAYVIGTALCSAGLLVLLLTRPEVRGERGARALPGSQRFHNGIDDSGTAG